MSGWGIQSFFFNELRLLFSCSVDPTLLLLGSDGGSPPPPPPVCPEAAQWWSSDGPIILILGSVRRDLSPRLPESHQPLDVVSHSPFPSYAAS